MCYDNVKILKHYEVLQYSLEYQQYRIEIVYTGYWKNVVTKIKCTYQVNMQIPSYLSYLVVPLMAAQRSVMLFS